MNAHANEYAFAATLNSSEPVAHQRRPRAPQTECMTSLNDLVDDDVESSSSLRMAEVAEARLEAAAARSITRSIGSVPTVVAVSSPGSSASSSSPLKTPLPPPVVPSLNNGGHAVRAPARVTRRLSCRVRRRML